MLTIIKTTQLKGNSRIGEDLVKVFDASVSSATPETLAFTSYIINYDLYKANRSAISADQIAFEDAVYAFQEELIAEQVTQ